jgi:hypothetical protein
MIALDPSQTPALDSTREWAVTGALIVAAVVALVASYFSDRIRVYVARFFSRPRSGAERLVAGAGIHRGRELRARRRQVRPDLTPGSRPIDN